MLTRAVLSLLILMGVSSAAWAGPRCKPYTEGSTHNVSYVYDGDSLKLADGRRVRLLGINTPEMGRDGEDDEPLAGEARDRLRALVAASGNQVRLLAGVKMKDAYGRMLAHGFTPDGANLSNALLGAGLGFMVVNQPDEDYLDCYHSGEQLARRAGKGLWAVDPSVRAADVKTTDKGFRLVRGTVTQLSTSRRSVWLKLDDRLAVRIDRADMDAFPELNQQAQVGRRVEVRGWLSRYRGEPVIRVRHPLSMDWSVSEQSH